MIFPFFQKKSQPFLTICTPIKQWYWQQLWALLPFSRQLVSLCLSVHTHLYTTATYSFLTACKCEDGVMLKMKLMKEVWTRPGTRSTWLTGLLDPNDVFVLLHPPGTQTARYMIYEGFCRKSCNITALEMLKTGTTLPGRKEEDDLCSRLRLTLRN